jgi:23S rRNA (cytosine1962-C5)-methyltransferase
VDVVTPTGDFIARGIYNSKSRIRVRLYTWAVEEPLDESFWRRRLERAVALRRQLGYDDPRAATRLVYSEADRLSGLIVDRYGDDLVVQITALATDIRRELLLSLLQELMPTGRILVRINPGAAQAEGLSPCDEWVKGSPQSEPTVFVEHGLEYAVRLDEGQKTGAYLDQRENHRAAAAYVAGRKTLDVCCYGGAFALCAARWGGASEVLGIDSSARAVEAAQENARRNGIANVRFQAAHFFDALQQMRDAGERFGAVILDPPRFAGSRREIDSALRAYHRLNRLAVEILEPRGILVTCSCSGHVTREALGDMLRGVGQRTRRDIQVLEARGAAPDHPVLLSCPETEYLKCLICRVD